MLPSHIPTAFKFLHPYKQSSTSLPRHAIVHAAAHNKGFLETFGTHVIALCQKNCQNPVLLSFWATITTEALTVKLSQSRIESHNELRKTQEDSIIRILSLLSRALSLKSIPGLRVACYMILTAVGCKCHLGDDILTSIMNAVTVGWENTVNAGIICLSALAQRRKDFRLPKPTLKALLAVKTIANDLVTLSKHYNVERLAFGLILGIIDSSQKLGFPEDLALAQTMIEASLLRPTYIVATIRAMLNAVQENRRYTKLTQKSGLEKSLADVVYRLADVKTIGHIVRDVLEGFEIHTRLVESDVEQAENALSLNLNPPIETRTAKPKDMLSSSEPFEALVNRIPTQVDDEKSFLSHAESRVFGSLSDAFISACQSLGDLDKFCNLPFLRKPLALNEPLFFSFFIKIWCGPSMQAVRVTAITVILNHLREQQHIPDVQILLPYIVYALGDPSNAVRNAAAQLTLALDQSYSKIGLQNTPNWDQEILWQDQFYSQEKESKRVSWLAEEEVRSLIRNILVPNLEECRLDAAQISRHLNACLKKGAVSQGSKQYGSELKKSLKLSVFTTLCDHIVGTPLYRVKARLLPIVTHIGSVGNTSCSKLMMPLLDKVWRDGQQEFETICEIEQLDVKQFANCLIEIISPIDKDSIRFLQNAIISCDSSFTIFIKACFQRLYMIWSVMKHQSQLDFANTMLEIAFPTTSDREDLKQTEAASTLQKVSLSALILQNLLDSLPRLSQRPGQPPAAKRRRVTHEAATTVYSTDISPLSSQIRKIYFLLELVEGSNTENDPSLLDGLFRILGDLIAYGRQAGTKLEYLELMAVESLLSISRSIEVSINHLRSLLSIFIPNNA